MNPTKGVLFGEASERRFQFAAVIPGISDGTGVDAPLDPGLDSDGDTLSDGLEQVLRSDPFGTDSDADGFTDKAEYGAGYDLADPLSNPLVSSADDIVGT